MKRLRQFLAAAFVLCLLAALLPAASAEADPRFEGRSWEEVTDEFLNGYGAYDVGMIGIGYYNTVTGEEHYVNADEFITVGSVYKVPLNMIYCERIANGEMTLDTSVYGIDYQTLLRGTIIDSNNDFAYTLWNAVGSYTYYRQQIAPYMGEDPDNVDYKFYENNLFTAREVITCLRTLYENPDRFPYLVDTMLEAEPTNYFRRDERRYPMAHKYGYDPEPYHSYLADSGIIYTTDPFLLVMLTDNSPAPSDLLAQYAVLMCDYTEYHTMERLRADAPMRALSSLSLPNPPGAVTGRTTAASSVPLLGLDAAGFARLMGVVAVMLLVLGVCLKLSRKSGYIVLLPALVVLIAGSLLCQSMLKAGGGSLFENRIKGNGSEAVDRFFTALEQRDYTSAASMLEGYTKLGLEDAASEAHAEAALEALRGSYAHRITGGSVEGDTATQTVQFTHMSYNLLWQALQRETAAVLQNYAAQRPESEVFDENFSFRQEIVDQAFEQAFQTVLADPSGCYTEDTIDLTLKYSATGWRLQGSQELAAAICGQSAG